MKTSEEDEDPCPYFLFDFDSGGSRSEFSTGGDKGNWPIKGHSMVSRNWGDYITEDSEKKIGIHECSQE